MGRGYRALVFTGIVRELGRVAEARPNGSGLRLRIAAPETAAASGVGDSVAVNGVCLTAVAVEDGTIAFDVVSESLERSTLGRLGPEAVDRTASRLHLHRLDRKAAPPLSN